jgi:tRNA(Ile)-lysidine synthase
VLERIAETTYKYIMFAPGQTVGVAVSGGADSVALLHVLRALSTRFDIRLRALHFDHQLRGEASDADRLFVEELASRYELPCDVGRADVAALARDSGDNLEQAARDARYGFFRKLLQGGVVDRVALGHTLSDQAETVLFRLLRGAGLAGLAAIHPVTGDGFVRPLIDIERPEIENWLAAEGHAWREDSSNASLAFDRNRIRHELLPALRRDWNPKLDQVLARLAGLARDEESYWAAEIDRLAPTVLERRSGAVLVDVEALSELDPARQRRIVRRAISDAKGDLRQIDAAHAEAVLDLVSRDRGDGQVDLPRLRVVRSFDHLRLAPPDGWPAPIDYRFAVSPPARYPIPGSNSVIYLEFEGDGTRKTTASRRYNTLREDALQWRSVFGSVQLRNWRPGDRFLESGTRRAKKIKELFQSKRIPSWDRASWPIIAKGDQVLWIKGFGVAAGFEAGSRSGPVLRIREEQVEGAP